MNKFGLSEALNVKVMGCGDRTLVLSHGFGSDQSVWRKILPSLLSEYKVITFDMVFSGKVNPNHFDFDRYTSISPYADDILTILEEQKVNKCTYVGHSMSGMVGCIASIKRPDLFEKLVLLCASPRYLDDESYHGGSTREEVNGLLSMIKSYYAAWISSFAPQIVGVDEPSMIKEHSRSLGNMKPEIAYHVLKTIFESDMRSILCDVKTPCSIIQTRKDLVVPVSVAYYMQQNLGGDVQTVDVLDTDGHLPHLTSPEMSLELLIHNLGGST